MISFINKQAFSFGISIIERHYSLRLDYKMITLELINLTAFCNYIT